MNYLNHEQTELSYTKNFQNYLEITPGPRKLSYLYGYKEKSSIYMQNSE